MSLVMPRYDFQSQELQIVSLLLLNLKRRDAIAVQKNNTKTLQLLHNHSLL